MILEPAMIASVLVAIIAAGSAYASQHAASRASTLNAASSSRVEMEKEAYERARKMDVETITRLDAEVDELRAENEELRKKNRDLASKIIHYERERRKE